MRTIALFACLSLCAYGQTTTVAGSRVVQGATNFAGPDTGSGNAYVTSLGLSSYTPGLQLSYLASHSNTGPATLNSDNLGAKAITLSDGVTPVAANALVSGALVQLAYNGNTFQLASSSAAAASPRVVYASRVPGVVSDAVITVGSTVYGSDAAAALNAVLANGNIHLIVDGTFGLSSHLSVSSNTWITVMPGCGFVMRAGANDYMLKNSHMVAATAPSGTSGYVVSGVVDQNIVIDGAGMWNANAQVATSSSDHKSSGQPNSPWLKVVNLVGVQHVWITGQEMYNAPTYGINMTNCTDVHIVGNWIHQPLPSNTFRVNTDGVHFVGPADHLWVQNNRIAVGDDAVALNADDGFRPASQPSISNWPDCCDAGFRWGPITEAQIEGNIFDDALNGVRLDSASELVDKINISHNTGTVLGPMIIISNVDTQFGGGNIGEALIDDLAVTTVAGDPFGLPPGSIWSTVPIRSLTVSHITMNNPAVQPWPLLRQESATVQNLILSDWSIINTSGQSVPVMISTGNGGSIARMAASNMTFLSQAGNVLFGGSTPPAQMSISGYVGDTTKLFATGYLPPALMLSAVGQLNTMAATGSSTMLVKTSEPTNPAGSVIALQTNAGYQRFATFDSAVSPLAGALVEQSQPDTPQQVTALSISADGSHVCVGGNISNAATCAGADLNMTATMTHVTNLTVDGTCTNCGSASGSATSGTAGLRQWLSALAGAPYHKVGVHVVADSLSACYTSTSGACGPVGPSGAGPTSAANRWPDLLAGYFRSQSLSAGTGFVGVSVANGGALNSQFWATSGTRAEAPGVYGPYQTHAPAGAGLWKFNPGATATFTAGLPYSTLRVACGAVNGSNTVGWQVAIDGATQAATACANQSYTGAGAGGISSYPVTYGNHTTSLTCPASGNSGPCYLYGAFADTSTVGVEVNNFGLGGNLTEAFGDGALATKLGFSDQMAPHDLTIVFLGTNDAAFAIPICPTGSTAAYCNGSFGTENYVTHLTNIISHEQGLGASTLVIAPPPITSSNAAAPVIGYYQQAAQAVASSTGSAYLDFSGIGTFAQANAAGLFTADGVHLNNAGADYLFRLLANTIGVAAPANSTGSSSSSSGALPSNITSSNNVLINSAGGANTGYSTVAGSGKAQYLLQNDTQSWDWASFGSAVVPYQGALVARRAPDIGGQQLIPFSISQDATELCFGGNISNPQTCAGSQASLGGGVLAISPPTGVSGLSITSNEATNPSGSLLSLRTNAGYQRFINFNSPVGAKSGALLVQTNPDTAQEFDSLSVSKDGSRVCVGGNITDPTSCAGSILSTGGGNLRIVPLTSVAPAGAKYFLCIDTNGVVNAQATACQ